MSNQIRDRIFGKSDKGKELSADDIDDFHDNLMVEYGWIPVEEFRNLPLPTFFNLCARINARRKKQSEDMERNKPKRRLK